MGGPQSCCCHGDRWGAQLGSHSAAPATCRPSNLTRPHPALDRGRGREQVRAEITRARDVDRARRASRRTGATRPDQRTRHHEPPRHASASPTEPTPGAASAVASRQRVRLLRPHGDPVGRQGGTCAPGGRTRGVVVPEGDVDRSPRHLRRPAPEGLEDVAGTAAGCKCAPAPARAGEPELGLGGWMPSSGRTHGRSVLRLHSLPEMSGLAGSAHVAGDKPALDTPDRGRGPQQPVQQRTSHGGESG